MSVDPGLTRTGVALWRGETLAEATLLKVSPRVNESWLDVAKRMNASLTSFFVSGHPSRVVIELPAYYGTSSGQMVAARGDLAKLTCLVGVYVQTAWSRGVDVTLVEPHEWKGQLPKEIVIQRVRVRIPEIDRRFAPKADTWDAIGIGLYALGRL